MGEDGDRKHELEALFERWDKRSLTEAELDDPGAPRADAEDVLGGMRYSLDKVRMWVTLTALVLFLSGWMMWQTRHELAYWLLRGTAPVELGDIGLKYQRGARTLDVESNLYVHASGLFATHESEAETEGGANARFYLCPMFDIVVRPPRPFPDKPFHRAASIEVEEGFIPLLQEHRAFPYDLVVPLEATGRLIRATDVPRWHVAPLLHYARAARRDMDKMWLLLEGEIPEANARFALLWVISLVMCCAALTLLFRSWKERGRERRASPARPAA